MRYKITCTLRSRELASCVVECESVTDLQDVLALGSNALINTNISDEPNVPIVQGLFIDTDGHLKLGEPSRTN